MKRNKYLRFDARPRLLTIIFIGLISLVLIAPMNFVLVSPGDPTALYPKTLTISGPKTYPADGNLYLLTVLITNPETEVPGAQVLGCWAWGDCAVAPRAAYYEKESNDKQERASGLKDMSDSQSSAVNAARIELEKRFPQIDISGLKQSAVKVNLENTGGPSGGLIFTLGLIELMTPEDLLAGRKVAGTGTIAADGTVGPIGGVTEKIFGAKSAKADLLFIPAANCDEAPAMVEGITVVAVSTVDEAITYLLQHPKGEKHLNSGRIRGCANVGA